MTNGMLAPVESNTLEDVYVLVRSVEVVSTGKATLLDRMGYGAVGPAVAV